MLAGKHPGSEGVNEAAAKLAHLREAGVDLFLDLTEAGEGDLPSYEHLIEDTGATYQRFPIADWSCPASQEMSSILDTIDAAIAAGRTVYAHCRGGIGRTGTVVGCYLVRHGWPAGEALTQVAEWREGSPETEEQRRFVREWREPPPKAEALGSSECSNDCGRC
jgi:protein-tyrosine phosphatase